VHPLEASNTGQGRGSVMHETFEEVLPEIPRGSTAQGVTFTGYHPNVRCWPGEEDSPGETRRREPTD
jgi:hypothetical protein